MKAAEQARFAELTAWPWRLLDNAEKLELEFLNHRRGRCNARLCRHHRRQHRG